MFSQAKAKYLRYSPTKVRPVLNLIRGKDVQSSLSILMQVNKGCSKALSKILQSAISNAKEKGVADDQLYISKVTADQGPSWKRWRAAPFGRATAILKKTTHITMELDLKTK